MTFTILKVFVILVRVNANILSYDGMSMIIAQNKNTTIIVIPNLTQKIQNIIVQNSRNSVNKLYPPPNTHIRDRSRNRYNTVCVKNVCLPLWETQTSSNALDIVLVLALNR